MPIILGPGNFYVDGEPLGEIYRVVIRDGIDAATGASVDDLIDDIDAVLDAYRESDKGETWKPPR